MASGENIKTVPRARLERIVVEKQKRIFDLNKEITKLKSERFSMRKRLSEVTKNAKS